MTYLSPEKLKRMREFKEQKRLEHPPPDYPETTPLYRRRITVEDFDFGYEKVVMHLYDSGRIDSYTIEIDGEIVAWRKGFARALNMFLDRFKRVMSLKNCY